VGVLPACQIGDRAKQLLKQVAIVVPLLTSTDSNRRSDSQRVSSLSASEIPSMKRREAWMENGEVLSGCVQFADTTAS
jgi:hypothetical protein